MNSHEEAVVRFFLPSSEMGWHQRLTLGVLDSGHSRERIEVWTPRRYTFRMWQAMCESTEKSFTATWSQAGCGVSEMSTRDVTVCSCSHLSTFRAVVTPVKVGAEEAEEGKSAGVRPVGGVLRVPIIDIIE